MNQELYTLELEVDKRLDLTGKVEDESNHYSIQCQSSRTGGKRGDAVDL